MIFPPSSEIWFYFESEVIFRLPGFLFLRFVIGTRPKAEQDNEFQRLAYSADDLPTDPNDREIQDLIAYLQSNVKWSEIEPFVTLSLDSRICLAKMWERKQSSIDRYSIHIHRKQLPDQLFRYIRYDRERLLQLFKENRLYLPSPSQFNDPFDCSLDEPTRLTFIECGMGCFSAKKDNILMFSHYADHHRGLCFGVNPIQLATSMSDPKEGIRADVRPIWYFSTMPPLNFKTQPALCATCKHDVWSYEEEYRLFLARESSLLPSGAYHFNPNSLTSVIFGCRASDECISFIKTSCNHLPQIKYFKACREPNRFGVRLLKIEKL